MTTTHQCDVVGLGSRRGETGHPQFNKRNIAHNFRGVTQTWLDGGNLYDPLLKAEYKPTGAGTFSPPAGDSVLGAGGHEQYAPIVLGTDLGYGIELRSVPGAQGALMLMFGDTRIAPVLGRSTDWPGGAILNDDVMGFTVQTASPGGPGAFTGFSFPHRCIDVFFPSQKLNHANHRFDNDPLAIDAVTMQGYARDGGFPMGSLKVSGPGFGIRASTSVPDKMFVMVPSTQVFPDLWMPCSIDAECVDAGEPGDRCVADSRAGSGAKICKFGPGVASGCTNGQQCFARMVYSEVGVVDGSVPHFKYAAVGTDMTVPAYLAFQGHFSVVNFARDPNTEGMIYAYGRDAWWGGSGQKMNPYLMKMSYNPSAGGVQAPQYFKGTCGNGGTCTDTSTNPDWSSNRADVRPVYTENKTIVWSTSVAYVPALANVGDKKPWVLLYGGRIPPVVLNYKPFYMMGPSTTGTETTLPADYGWSQSAGIYMRRAAKPWGPWTAPVTVFSAYDPWITGHPSNSGYCSTMFFDPANSPAGTPASCANVDPTNLNPTLDRIGGPGAEYGAEILGRYSESITGGASIYWLMSTWNPYRVILQKTDVKP